MKRPFLCGLAMAVACGLSIAFADEPSRDLLKPTEQLVNIRSLAFSPDGWQLAGCFGEPADKGAVVVWDAKTHKVRWSYGIERGMPSVAFSPDGKILAVGSFTEKAFLFDADTGKLRSTLPGHGEAARSLAFTTDGQTLAIGSYDQTIRVWDWRASKVKQVLTGQADKVYKLAYSPDSKILVSGGSVGSACLWDAASGKLLHRWDRFVLSLAFDPKGQWLATAGNDSTVTLRSLKNYEESLAHYDRIFAYQVLLIHPSAKTIAVSSGTERVVRLFPLDLQQATPADEKRIRQLMALWDDDDFAVREKASQDLIQMGHVTLALLEKGAKEAPSAEVRIRAREVLRSLGAPKLLTRLQGHVENVLSASFSPDGHVLATGGRDGRVLLWDSRTYKLIATMKWPEKSQ